jgi:hypothetical protein
MPANPPRSVEFRSVKQLINRFNASRETERSRLISVDEFDVPSWQRQVVWTLEDMGLLAYSITHNYPIGMIILWRKPDSIRVPIDGRQRLTAIRAFAEGRVAIPSLRHIPPELHNTKYKLLDGDEAAGYRLLDMTYREVFDDYEPSIYEYEDIDERTAMDIFVKLQGGKSLTKAEVRAALGGRLCDFITDLTSPVSVGDADYDEVEETLLRHPFFAEINLPNTRKAHRNLCDVLLHEFLYPGQDKHWSSLETMYLDKAVTLSEDEKDRFRQVLNRFYRDVQIEIGGQRRILPQLRSTFLILTYFRAWKELHDTYVIPNNLSFSDIIRRFETERSEHAQEIPWVNFNAALSNAGYAQIRIKQRQEILTSFILREHPTLAPRDLRRAFTEQQKIAIWDRANGRCEWIEEDGNRCQETFANFRDADADHIMKWADGGPTTVENGRLLCQFHNRSRRDS